MNTQTVELHQAFFWTCEACGRDNYARAIAISPDSPDGREFLRRLQIQGIKIQGEILATPTTVKCGECAEKFKVEP